MDLGMMRLFSSDSRGVVEEDDIPTPRTSLRKRSELDDEAKSSHVIEATTSNAPKPFFIMDWLDDFKQNDLQLAWRLVQRDSKSNQKDVKVTKSKSSSYLCRELSDDKTKSLIKNKSIAVGNGWNAKGLGKAKKGNWEGALECWQNALEIRSQILGDTHIDVANTHNNMGIALGRLGRFPEALEHLECALDIRIFVFGETHAEIATTLHNVGNVLHQAGDMSGAIRCFGDARRMQEQVLGEHHVHVARACYAMGQVYSEAGHFEDAVEAFSDALAIFERNQVPQDDEEIKNTRKEIEELTNLLSSL